MSPEPRTPEPLLLATRSADKAREIAVILRPVLQRELVTLDYLRVPADPEEDAIEIHDTFVANAVAKAQYFRARTGLDVIADDSGLAVDALQGAPGVRSRRFSGAALTGRALDHANNQLLLRRLARTPAAARGAHYVCAAALLAGSAPLVALGTVSGLVAHAPAGDHGFGYDPLFEVPALGATFAQISLENKNRYSHRARAFRALAALSADHLQLRR